MKSDKERPYSPTNLSESDMQALWLQIFQRFTTAAYTSESISQPHTLSQYSSRSPSLTDTVDFSDLPTVCHGTGSEKQALLSALQSSTADTTKS